MLIELRHPNYKKELAEYFEENSVNSGQKLASPEGLATAITQKLQDTPGDNFGITLIGPSSSHSLQTLFKHLIPKENPASRKLMQGFLENDDDNFCEYSLFFDADDFFCKGVQISCRNLNELRNDQISRKFSQLSK